MFYRIGHHISPNRCSLPRFVVIQIIKTSTSCYRARNHLLIPVSYLEPLKGKIGITPLSIRRDALNVCH